MKNTLKDLRYIYQIGVIPLILKMWVVRTFSSGDGPVTLCKGLDVDRLESYPYAQDIPMGWHRPCLDTPLFEFRYDLILTFESLDAPETLASNYPAMYVIILHGVPEKERVEVAWLLESPDRLSKHQIDSLVQENVWEIAPPCHPTLIGYEIYGLWHK